ncbi:BspC domain-containing protein [Caballeronia sp. M23-90]
MDSIQVPRRLLRLVGRLVAIASVATITSALFNVTAFADTVDDRNELVNHFVTDFNANPLMADCAAHGSFVASTSTAFDRVEFPASSFDAAHGSIVPWNDSFDDHKQRIKVDNVVTVEGLGVSKDGDATPPTLKFRCGYVGSQMLAFGWNDPVPAARPRAEPRSGHSARGKHSAVKGKAGSKGKASASTAKKSSSAKSTKKKH